MTQHFKKCKNAQIQPLLLTFAFTYPSNQNFQNS